MSAYKAVRQNPKSVALISAHTDYFSAGIYKTSRNHFLMMARRLPPAERGACCLIVDLARDSHRDYLKCLARIRLQNRAQTYETRVLDLVRGVLP